eukprot:CAMPEP_0203750778 /NCGR_PEP_ID=MMETSP0098-20131031/4957_1 /ASSEMBLY_ACC=CAM_ASM_000208 /TAXON_ID=96639 /ORGANISM=" , Strain NY0313808BC1" /LENGTH=764 /DNA_ID=CAMNT_0050640219 /DNA_START=611 /DNA_END=2901 /DNA_ORIENTATION=+
MTTNYGKIEFANYDQNPVSQGSRERMPLVKGNFFTDVCLDLIDSDPEAAKNQSECKFDGTKTEIHEKDNYIPTSTYYNDLWQYNLACERYADESCTHEKWEIVDPGARLGGCLLRAGEDICTHPHERYSHSASVVNDEFFVVWGGFSRFCGDYCEDTWIYTLPVPGEGAFEGTRWRQLEVAKSPGKRWKATNVLIDSSTIFLFGGHRLWHGFSDENARSNRYKLFNELPKGGYLDDLWKLDVSNCLLTEEQKALSVTERVDIHSKCVISWTELVAKRNCTSRTLFDNGQLKPGWEWEERFEQICFTTWPAPRSGHAMTYRDGYLYVHGGYRTFFPYAHTRGAGSGMGTSKSPELGQYRPYPRYHHFLDDMWKYDLSSGFWHKVEYEGPEQPRQRAQHSLIASEEVLIVYGGYQANVHMNDLWFFNVTTNVWHQKKKFVHPHYPENCTEGGWVLHIPTLGTTLDGKFGRASEHVIHNQTRRRSPGWDGCRDRHDGRRDLPWDLQWQQPLQRSHHSVAYHDEFKMMLVYGGHGMETERLERVDYTFDTATKGDLWQYRMHQCINNCSNNGHCRFGNCRCNSGYYGIDCSNHSCPGDFCYYNEETQEQVCSHCCHAPHVHTDEDVYIPDLGKKQCSKELPGRSNGVCNGFGKCLCAPPFIGLDCSIKDCPNKCSNNGWCSEEYPVSRCMCDPGFTGHDCSLKECLNNCSYPNGECQNGTCLCMVLPDPYDRDIPWRRLGGDDCSFIIPYADASTITTSILLFAAVIA